MFGFSRLRAGPKKEIIVNCEPLETRVATIVDGKLQEFQIEHPYEERMVGSIYKGRVQNVEPGLQAAFVDIGAKKNAFIHYWDMIPEDAVNIEEDEEEEEESRRPQRRKRYTDDEIARRFPVGSEIVVQVTKGPISTKGARVTANLSIPGRFLVLMPGTDLRGVSRKIEDEHDRHRLKRVLNRLPLPPGTGVIVRTAGRDASKRSIVRDLRVLTALWQELQKGMAEKSAPCPLYQEPDLVERVVRDSVTEDISRIVVDTREEYDQIKAYIRRFAWRSRVKVQLYEGDQPIFDYFDVARQIDEAFRRKVNLPSGGYLVFDETEAMVAIDVNTGKHKGSSSAQGILEVNLEAVDEIARQLRLRNIGGLLVIDLIDMRQKKHQNAVYKRFRQALRTDKARTNVLPISRLGILEMSRQRVDEGILSATHTDCPYCHGRGFIKSALSVSVELQRRIGAVLRKLGRTQKTVNLQIVVNPGILERLRREDEAVLMDMETKLGGHLAFRTDPNLHFEHFVIMNGDAGEVLYRTTEK